MRDFEGAIEDVRGTLCLLVIKGLEKIDDSNRSTEVLNLNTKRLQIAGIILQQTFEVGRLPPLTRRRLNPLEIGASHHRHFSGHHVTVWTISALYKSEKEILAGADQPNFR
jgi:hypothetical protein